MNKKQFIAFLAAVLIFVAAGFAGVRSAQRARENSAAYAQQLSESLTSALSPSGETSLPGEPYVAKVEVTGTIAESAGASLTGVSEYDHQGLLDYIDALIGDENNVGMLLYVDSPGGEIKAADELYLKLMDYKATQRPIYCFFDSTACSGGYYVAMPADEIWADRNCMCVNIGVYISTYNLTGLFEKLGVEQVVFKSSENKGIGMAGVPWTEEQKEIYQSIVDEYYDQFLAVVAEGRGMTKEQVAQKDDGREMLASQALRAGFIDGICRYEEYEQRVLSQMGTDLLYEPVSEESSFLELMRYFSSAMPRSDTQALLDFAQSHSGMVVMAYDENR